MQLGAHLNILCPLRYDPYIVGTISTSKKLFVLELSATYLDGVRPKNRNFFGTIFCRSDITMPSALWRGVREARFQGKRCRIGDAIARR